MMKALAIKERNGINMIRSNITKALRGRDTSGCDGNFHNSRDGIKLALRELDRSIEKWAGVAFLGWKDIGTFDCRLCDLYFDQDEIEGHEHCKFCPVRIITLKDGCRNTPYEEWANHQRVIHDRANIVLCERCKDLAINELIFLLGVESVLKAKLRELKRKTKTKDDV